MKKKIQIAIALLMFGLILSQGTMTAYAETEGATEGGMVVTQSGNASADTTLSSLKIAQAALHPEFDPNQLTYTATVPYEVERVALTAQTNCPDAKKVIRGTSDLEVGENVITVTVTAQNGATREYRITLIRQEMPETSGPEGSDVPASSEEETQPDTSEQESDQSSAEETISQEDTTEEATLPPETIIIPPDTEGNGGMVVETLAEDPQDNEGLFSNRTVLILILAAICLVSLFAIVAVVIVRRESDLDDDDEEDESLDDEDFDTISNDVLVDASENDVADDSDDDLDDDFEMLLEDDDDFDFLDF